MYDLIIQYGHAAVVGILSVLGIGLTRYVFSAIKRAWLIDALSRLWIEAKKSVLAVEQAYVKGLKEGMADDGKLSAAERAKAKGMALDVLKSNYGMVGLRKLARVLGIDSIDGWLGSTIEAALGDTAAPPKPEA